MLSPVLPLPWRNRRRLGSVLRLEWGVTPILPGPLGCFNFWRRHDESPKAFRRNALV